jgi:DNA-binding HxlR family transcriptional regulator
VAGASTADILRLLSAGATGAILMALGEGPLRTKRLAEHVPSYAPRTIYRCAGRLVGLAVIEREEQPGVPSKVMQALSDPCGTDLFGLITRFADASFTRLPDGRIDAYDWASLGLLADLWEAGMVEELVHEGHSPTEMSKGSHGLSYHQINRRTGLFLTAGMLSEGQRSAPSHSYGLTEKTRRRMGLVAGIARWRHQHVVAGGEEAMTSIEMATLLRAALPLAKIPEHAGKCMRLNVLGEDDVPGADGQIVWAEVALDGTIHSRAEQPAEPHGWARGRVNDWIPVALGGETGAVLFGGELLIGDALPSIYRSFWT